MEGGSNRRPARSPATGHAATVGHRHPSSGLILYGCGDFLNDYEGIGGYEEFRGDLTLLYLARLARTTGNPRFASSDRYAIRRSASTVTESGRWNKRLNSSIGPTLHTVQGVAPGNALFQSSWSMSIGSAFPFVKAHG